MRIHGRTRLLIGALSTAFALAISATAGAHDLSIYKVEKQVDLDSDETTVDLGCKTGDYALDGMWRIDQGDYDEDDTSSSFIGRAVDVQEAYPFDTVSVADTDTKYDSYRFVFVKNAIGRGQAKVFLTCIGAQTEGARGHVHDVPVAPMASTTYGPGTGDTPWPGTAGSATAACAANQFVATPGFRIARTNEEPNVGELSQSWPSDVKTWSWRMDLGDDPNAAVTFYASCASRKIQAVAGEKHKLVYKLQGPEKNDLAANAVRTKRIACKPAYKAVVSGFSLTGVTSAPETTDYGTFNQPNYWFLGMDPQPRNRDLKFLNSSGVAGTDVANIKATCLNYRTT